MLIKLSITHFAFAVSLVLTNSTSDLQIYRHFIVCDVIKLLYCQIC